MTDRKPLCAPRPHHLPPNASVPPAPAPTGLAPRESKAVTGHRTPKGPLDGTTPVAAVRPPERGRTALGVRRPVAAFHCRGGANAGTHSPHASPGPHVTRNARNKELKPCRGALGAGDAQYALTGLVLSPALFPGLRPGLVPVGPSGHQTPPAARRPATTNPRPPSTDNRPPLPTPHAPRPPTLVPLPSTLDPRPSPLSPQAAHAEAH